MINTSTVGWSDFAANRHKDGTGFSYSLLSNEDVVSIVQQHWKSREPGYGETDCSRKVVVTIPADDLWRYCPRIELKPGLPVHCRVVTRQEGEDPFVENYVRIWDALAAGWTSKVPENVRVVCYSAEALLENDGHRSTDCDWEIVAILCDSGETEPMHPLTMARNYLEMPGGTKTEYSAKDFAEAIYYHSTKGLKVINDGNVG